MLDARRGRAPRASSGPGAASSSRRAATPASRSRCIGRMRGFEVRDRDAGRLDARARAADARCSAPTSSSRRPTTGSNGAVLLARELAEADPDALHAVPVRQPGEPARARARHGRGDPRVTAPRSTSSSPGSARAARSWAAPAACAATARRADRRRRAAARRGHRRPALARGRLHARDPRPLAARPQAARQQRRVGARPARAGARGGPLRGRLLRRRRCTPRCASRASSRARRTSSWCSPTAAGSTSRPASGTRPRTSSPSAWSRASGGDGSARALADEMIAHARSELPNESCGIFGGTLDGELRTFFPAKQRRREPLPLQRRCRRSAAHRARDRRGRRRRGGDLPLAHDVAGDARRAPTWSSRPGPRRPTSSSRWRATRPTSAPGASRRARRPRRSSSRSRRVVSTASPSRSDRYAPRASRRARTARARRRLALRTRQRRSAPASL